MKKKLPVLIGLIVLLAVLSAVYVIYSNSENEDETAVAEEEEETSDANSSSVVFKAADDIDITEIRAVRNEIPDGLYIYEPYDLNDRELKIYLSDDDSYYIEGYETCVLGENMSGYISGFRSVIAETELTDHDELSAYGLDSPKGEFYLTLSDGSEVVISVGNATADKVGHYVKISDSDSVYVVVDSLLSSWFYGLNDLLDKTLPELNLEEITFVSVVGEAAEKDLLMSYEEEDSSAEGNNLTTLIMHNPVSGLVVYPYNLQTTILSGFSQLKLCDIVEIGAKDLSLYGLDEPQYELTFIDTETVFALDIGYSADNTYTYCKLPEGDIVYTTYTAGVDPAVNYNIYEFVERFVNLQYRRNIDNVSIETSDGKNYVLSFGEDSVNKEGVDNRVADLNGKQYERTEISDFYQLLVGIVFERIEENSEITGEPGMTISYTLLDGSVSTDKYFDYDSNYYIVEKDGVSTGFIVSKTYVSRMLTKAAELTAEG
ncbi:MAG: DUF4340 domain-containing protein [Clostridiales bacterium]|nr:DUF4340 domain-containing protein [Clostridiales bacterium]